MAQYSGGLGRGDIVFKTAPSSLNGGPFITTYSMSVNTFCQGAAVSVTFTASQSMNAGNIYTAQLSDAVGSFTAPVSIGTLASSFTLGVISATIPTSASAGSSYRIRVVSSMPAIDGLDNGNNLTIYASPNLSFSATSFSINAGTSATITAAGATSYTWHPGNYTSSSVVVMPYETTLYKVIGKNSKCQSNDSVRVTINSGSGYPSVYTQTISSTGNGSLNTPPGVNMLWIEGWGGGGAGGRLNGTSIGGAGGGSGGAYAQSIITFTSSLQPLYYYVAPSASNAANTVAVNGYDTYVNKLSQNSPSLSIDGILAKGGLGALGAVNSQGAIAPSASLSVGQIVYEGGNGSAGTSLYSGGAGAGASKSSKGASGVLNNGGIGIGGGGSGANGQNSNAPGLAGFSPGGGGSGGAVLSGSSIANSGVGASGRILITYVCPVSAGTIFVSPSSTVTAGNTLQLSSSVSGGTWGTSNVVIGSINSATGTFTASSAGVVTITYSVAATGCPAVSATQTISVIGNCVAPATKVTALTISSLDKTTANITWINSASVGRVIYLNTVNVFNDPLLGENPSPNTVYSGSGQQCVYNGSSASTVAVSGLLPGTNYYMAAYEYCIPNRVYNSTENVSQFKTLCDFPSITSQSSSQTTALSNGAPTLSVLATGQNLTYQWYSDIESTSTITPNVVPDYVPTTGLMGWWPFNGNANDESGNDYHGSVTGAVLTTDRFGNSNNAYSFDGGGNNRITVPNITSLNGRKGLTMSVWTKLSGIISSTCSVNCLQDLISRGNLNGYDGELKLSYNELSSSQKFQSRINQGSFQSTISSTVQTTVPQNDWHHVVMTYDGTSQKLYVDGALVTSSPFSSAILSSAANFIFSPDINPVYGKLDDIGIWNRALTQQEITRMYHGNAGTAIAGATGTSYTPNNPTAVKKTYYCKVSSDCGALVTDPIAVTLVASPTVGLISGSATLCAMPNTVTLTYSLTSGVVQWQQSTDNGVTWTDIAGANTATYVAVNTFTTTLFRVKNSNLYGYGQGVTDIDGNYYRSGVIGTQEWMADNLNVSRYQNGDAIPKVADGGTWSALTTGAWSHYADSASYANPYGKLYNWFAVVDSRSICPTGWHVPTDDEYVTLANFLGGKPVAGGKMKALKTWDLPNTGATNLSGFTALPGGVRNTNGGYTGILNTGAWWTSVAASATNAYEIYLTHNGSDLFPNNINKNAADNVRCVKDVTGVGVYNEVLSPTATISITNTVSATVGITASSNPVCLGSSVSFSTSSTNGGLSPSYQWKKNGVNISGATSSTYSVAAPNSNDAFLVTMTSNATCVTNSVVNSNTINLSVAPSLSLTGSKTNVACYGYSTGSVNVTVNGGYPFITVPTVVLQQTLSGCPATSSDNASYFQSFKATNTGSVTAIELKFASSFGETPTVKLFGGRGVVGPLLASGTITKAGIVTWTLSTPAPIVNGQEYSVQLSDGSGVDAACDNVYNEGLSGGGNSGIFDLYFKIHVFENFTPYNYAWSNAATTQSITSLSAGNYSITVTDAAGCSTSTNVVITQPLDATGNTTITAQSIASQTVCQNTVFNPITITATGTSLTYQWYSTATSTVGSGTLINGATANSYTPSSVSVGTMYYYCVVSGSCGVVTSSVSGAMVVKPLNTVGSIASTPTVCSGNALSIATHTTTGASGIGTASGLPSGVSPLWNSNTVSISGTPNISGSYSYTIPLTGGCGTANATGTIVVNSSPSLSVSSSSSSVCANATVTLNGSGANLNYTWMPGSLTGSVVSVSSSVTTTYTLIGTNTNGCSNTSTVLITILPNKTIGLTSAGMNKQTLCSFSPLTPITYTTLGITSVSISGLAPGASYTYTSGLLTISGTPSVAGTYSYYVSTSGSCGSATTTGTLVINPINVSGTVSANQYVCIGTAPRTMFLAGQQGNIQWQSSPDNATWSNITGAITNSLTGNQVGNLNQTTYFRSVLSNSFCPTVYSNTVTVTTVSCMPYYSKGSGNLNELSTWGSNLDGTGSSPISFSIPGLVYNIRNNPTPTLGGHWQLLGTDSKVILGDGVNPCVFTLPSSYVFDIDTLQINNKGVFKNQNVSLTSLGSCQVMSGGTYQHDVNGGVIPYASWLDGSNCKLSAITNTAPTGHTQNFYNLSWECPAQTIEVPFNTSVTIRNNLLINSGNTATLSVAGSGGGIPTPTLVVGNNLVLSSGNFLITNTGTGGKKTLTVLDSTVLNGGNFNMCGNNGGYTMSSEFNTGDFIINDGGLFDVGGGGNIITAVINFKGSLINKGTGIFKSTSSTSTRTLNFAGTGNEQIYNNSSSGYLKNNFTVWNINSGAVVRLASNLITDAAPTVVFNVDGTLIFGTGSTQGVNDFYVDHSSSLSSASNFFKVNSGAVLKITSPNGIQYSNSIGNIRTSGSGSRYQLNAGAHYHYIGDLAQITGTALPSALTGSLVINNPSGVTLTKPTLVSGTLGLQNGNLTTASSTLITITNTISTAIVGGGSNSYINGPLKWKLPLLSNSGGYQFPVGKNGGYYPFTLSSLTVNNPTITVEAFTTNSGGTMGAGLCNLSNSEYWQLTTNGGTYTDSKISLGRSSVLNGLNAIAMSSTLNGTYANLSGTVTGTSINNSVLTGSITSTTSKYFVLATSGTAPSQPASISGNTLVCSGISQTYSVTPESDVSYSWQLPIGWSGASTNHTIAVTPGVAAGSISVTASNTCGISPPQTLSISVESVPILTLTIAAQTSSCSNSPATLTASGANTYSWMPVSLIGSLVTVTPSVTTTYSVIGTTAGGCVGTQTIIVSVNPLNTVSGASSSPTVCIGSPLSAITHTTSGATGIGTASGLPGGVSASWASNLITISGTPTVSGTYAYNIPLTGGCGTVSATGTIVVNALPNLNISSGQIPTQGLVGWWPFSGNANDESGNGNNGIATNAVLTSDRNNNINSSYDFTNGYVTINENSYSISNAITISAWVKLNQIDGLRIAAKHSGCCNTANYGWMLAGDGPSNSYSWVISTDGNNWIGGNTANGTANLNIWQHVVATYDGHFMRVYINGLESLNSSFPKPQTGNLFLSSSPLTIGKDGGSAFFTKGKIDDIGIWNRALTGQEITSLYLNGFNNFCSGQTVTLTASGANTYSWTPVSLTGSLVTVTPSVTTTYSVIGTTAGGCVGTQTITVSINSINTVSGASSSPTICTGSPLSSITHTTSGATGIGTASGLPGGVTASWTSNLITISGTPTVSGTYAYNIPLTGGCGTVSATGTIVVNALPTLTLTTSASTVCANSSVTLTASGALMSPSYSHKP